MEEPRDPLFENPPIDVSALPHLSAVDWQSLHPKYLPIRLAGVWIFTFFLCGLYALVVLSLFEVGEQPLLYAGLPAAVLLLALFASLVEYKGFRHKAYALRQRDILYKSGWIFRQTVAVPFVRIQHSETHQGPIERRYGLAELNIFTAGGQGGDLTIPGLTLEQARSLKAFILQKIAEDE